MPAIMLRPLAHAQLELVLHIEWPLGTEPIIAPIEFPVKDGVILLIRAATTIVPRAIAIDAPINAPVIAPVVAPVITPIVATILPRIVRVTHPLAPSRRNFPAPIAACLWGSVRLTLLSRPTLRQ